MFLKCSKIKPKFWEWLEMTKKSNAKKLKFVKSVLRSKFEADLVLIIEEKSFFFRKNYLNLSSRQKCCFFRCPKKCQHSWTCQHSWCQHSWWWTVLSNCTLTDTLWFGQECHQVLSLQFFSKVNLTFGQARTSVLQFIDKRRPPAEPQGNS